MKSLLALVTCLFGWTLSAWGASLTLEDIIGSVKRHYPLIRASQMDQEKAEADALAARGGFDPTLKMQLGSSPTGYYDNHYAELSVEQPTTVWGTKLIGGWRTAQGKFHTYDPRSPTFSNGEVHAGFEVPLLRNGWIDEKRAKVQSTEAGVDASVEGLNLQQLETVRLASARYWDCLAAREKLKIAQMLLSVAEKRDQAILTKVEKGDIPQIEHVENQRALFQRRLALVAAERTLQKEILDLSLYFRDEKGAPALIEPTALPDAFPPWQQAIDSALVAEEVKGIQHKHPELKRLSHQQKQNEVELNLSQNQFLPKLDLKLLASKDLGFATQYSVTQQYPNEVKAIVSFEIPLFLRAPAGRVQSARSAVSKVEAQTQMAHDRIRNNIKNSAQAIEAARKKIDLATLELEYSRKLENAERIRFQNGDSSLLLVNIREQATGDASLRQIDAFAEYFRAVADYKASAAHPN